MAANLTRLLMAGGGLCLGFAVQALEILPDPTKPAIDISATATSGVGAGSGGGGATESAPAASVQSSAKDGLQSVILSSKHRAAVINGQTVELGGKVGDAILVEVRENSVVLQGAQGRRVMELFPGVRLMKTEPAKPTVQKAKEDKPIPAKNKKKKHAGKKKTSGTTCSGQNKDERESK